jgi:hypothetical protein
VQEAVRKIQADVARRPEFASVFLKVGSLIVPLLFCAASRENRSCVSEPN